MNVMIDPLQFPVWKGGELRCLGRGDETHDSASFELVPETTVRFDFKPGQFVTIGIDIGGTRHYRAYSISSSPSRAESITITVKRVNGGKVSNYLLDHFYAGACVDALAPAGEFYLDVAAVPKKIVMLSAGSGITPLMAMVRWLLDQRPQTHIRFIHSAHSEKDIIFHEELLAMVAQHTNFELDLFLSQPDGGGLCHIGRLTPDRLDALVPDAAECSLYLCGHQHYMDMVVGWYSARQLPLENFHQESFTPAELSIAESSGQVFQLSVPAFGKTAEIADGQTLLEVLEAEGIPILAACRSGMCGSCKCKVTEGEVERTSIETLTQEDISAGMALACSSLARSSLVVELLV